MATCRHNRGEQKMASSPRPDMEDDGGMWPLAMKGRHGKSCL